MLKLNECFRLDFLEDLVAKKASGENISVGAIDWPFHEARLDELEAEMERAYRESTLPEDRDRRPINELLVRLIGRRTTAIIMGRDKQNSENAALAAQKTYRQLPRVGHVW